MSPGSPLNRLSFLRTDHSFLSKAVIHPTTSFLLLNELWPLAKDSTKLVYARYQDVKPLIGEDPFKKSEEQLLADYDSARTIPILVFLGINEKDQGLTHGIYSGAPYFALDISSTGSIADQASELRKSLEGKGSKFLEGRMQMNFDAPDAAIFAQARSLVDWNRRNPFCAQCGHQTLSVHGGTKRICPPTDYSASPSTRPPCVARTGVNNITFPRTDPTVIMAVVSVDGKRVLVGRQKRWPSMWYSTLAGFIEPAESIEEAVRREVWEESGVKLGRVVIHSSQPWPYPANLMIGAIAQAAPGGEQINLKHEPELEDARWVLLDEIREALRVGSSGLGEAAGPDYKEGNIRVPPPTAIANQLLQAVVDGFVGDESKI
ncbi:MAG: NADH pyrophosphatase [Vezdaea aestivalis]|nr:MAG: NADH pyrophosphatase [Vezdaea aestivalis]